MTERKCITHHHACDCREAMFATERAKAKAVADDLALAVKFIRQGKAQFAPNTTNSDVDDFLEAYDKATGCE